MRIAIIDLGTNTFNLLIADVRRGKFESIYKAKMSVKLGEGSILRNKINPLPYQRGIDAMIKYRKIIDKFHVDKVYAFGTSAIRSGVNGDKFVKEINSKTDISVKVISGSKEAELIYYGVRQCIKLSKPALIMDIGGGSTEFIIADDKKIYWKKSFNIGAARLLEKFKASDPISYIQIIRLEKFLEKQLSPLIKSMKKFAVKSLVGSSGSFDTFAEMAGYRFHRKNLINDVNSYQFNLDEYFRLHEIIIRSKTEQRLIMRGLIKMRVDMIVIASVCTNYILKKFEMKEMHLSKYALKEGALFDVLKNLRINK